MADNPVLKATGAGAAIGALFAPQEESPIEPSLRGGLIGLIVGALYFAQRG